MYEIIANLLKESKKTTVITGDGISIDSQKIDYKTSVDNQVYNGINLSKLCNKDFDKSDNNFISKSLHMQMFLMNEHIKQMKSMRQALNDAIKIIDQGKTVDWSYMLEKIYCMQTIDTSTV